MLNVESAIAQAESYYGIIPEEAYMDIKGVVDNNEVKISRVKETKRYKLILNEINGEEKSITGIQKSLEEK